MLFCRIAVLCLLATIIMVVPLQAQRATQADALIQVPEGLTKSINKKVSGLDDQLQKQSAKYINKLSRQEQIVLKQLSKIDSSAAAHFLKDSKALYNKLSNKLSNAGNKTDQLLKGDYIPYLDSLQTSLGFLKDAKGILSQTKGLQEKLDGSLSQVKQLQNRLGEAADIQQAIKQRQRELKQLLSNYTNLPKHLSKAFGKYQQQAFYYGQQLRSLGEDLKDPEKLISKTLNILKTVPAFQSFWKKHSILSQLFPNPDNPGAAQSLTGLQTRADVQAVLQQQMGLPAPASAGNANPTGMIQQQLQQAQSEMNTLKDKLSQLGMSSGGSEDVNMPDFSPDQQKTRSFWKRIEYGSNFQTQKSNTFFPVTTDVALTIGYKINDKTTIGLGGSGRLGWGQNWKHIKITGEGVSMRSYIDWKAPDLFKMNSKFIASLWFTAGAEINYHKKIEELTVFKNYNNWNKSALAGLTKKYSMRSPLKKGKMTEGKVQVLYDFLHRQHIPQTPAFVWRVGWGL